MRRGGRGEKIPKDQGDFPWYNFPQVVSQRTLAEWRRRLEKLKKNEFYIANEVSWSWLEQVGLVEAMKPYLTNVFINKGVKVTCTAWRRLFQILDSVYKEPCQEFYATIQLQGGDDPFDTHNFTFYLGGVYR